LAKHNRLHTLSYRQRANGVYAHSVFVANCYYFSPHICQSNVLSQQSMVSVVYVQRIYKNSFHHSNGCYLVASLTGMDFSPYDCITAHTAGSQEEGLVLRSHSVIKFITRRIRSRLGRDVTSGPKRLRPTWAKSVRDVSCIPITSKFTDAMAECSGFMDAD